MDRKHPLPWARPALLFDDAVLSLDARLALVLLALFAVATFVPRNFAFLTKFLSSLQHSGGTDAVPRVSSAVPCLGHAWGLQRHGARYLHRLLLAAPAPLFTINVLCRRVLVAGPDLDRALARHLHDTSLSQVIGLIGRRSLGMSAAAVRIIAEHDPRPIHSRLFSGSQDAAALADAATAHVRRRFRAPPPAQEVQLGRWLFHLVVGASAHALWGPQNPWVQDKEFMRQFVIMSDSFESLSQPMPWLTARPVYRARQFLVDRLVSFHHEHRESRTRSVAHHINAIAMNDANWEAGTDYFRCELLEALGLLATASTLSVWLIRHILADDELCRAVTDQVRQLHVVADELDLGDMDTTCPYLVAAWYETLRLHVTVVPRVASRAFELATPAPVPVRKDDVILLPMLSFNLDARTWGADAAVFRPARFLDPVSGHLLATRTRKVRAFGVAGNLCPGRTLGFRTAMAAVATLLRDFDIAAPRFPAPVPRPGISIGFERLADDVSARLTPAGPR